MLYAEALDLWTKCPECGSTNWRCWDERTFDCWSANGDHHYKVVGYLRCTVCDTYYTDVSVRPPDDCDCEED